MENVRELLKEPPPHIKGKVVNHHVFLDITEDVVHYWSPQLNFRIEPDEDDPEQTLVAGLIGPRPGVWTLFMFIYFSIALTGFVISSIGVSKWMLGEYSNLVWAFPIATLFMSTAWVAGKYGETLADDQIEMLKQFVRDAINIKD